MKNKAPVIALLVSFALLSGLIASCSNSNDSPQKTSSNPSATTTPATSASPTSPLPVTTSQSQKNSTLIIDSAAEENIASLEGRLEIIIPANTFSAGTQVAINELNQPVEHEFGGFVSRGVFEITASQTSEFSNAVTIEFNFDPDDLNSEYEAAEQIAVAFFDEAYQVWREVDCVIDEDKGKIVVETSHFSLWAYFFLDEKQVVMNMPGFTIYFNQEINAPIINSGMSGQPIFEYAAMIRSALYDAYHAYDDAKFKLPEHTRVYIDDWGHDKEAEWGWYSKNIEIPTSYINEDELKMVAAHEYFHAVQNQYVTFATMAADRWWMEATAEYASAYVAFPYGYKEKLELKFFDLSLNSDETHHMYQAGHFVKFLANRGYSFKELFEAVVKGDERALVNLNTYINARGESLAGLYDAFAYQALITNAPYTATLEGNIYTSLVKNKRAYDLDASSREIELVNVASNYAAGLSGFRLESKRGDEFIVGIRAIEPTPGAKVQYVLSSDASKDSVISTGYLNNNSIELKVEGGQYLFFLATNFAPQNGYVTVVIDGGQAGETSYSNSRTASVYNSEYIVDIDFSFLASKPFMVIEESVEGDTQLVTIQFLRSDSDIVIDLEANVENIRYADPVPGRSLFIGEEYWAWTGNKSESNTAQLVISPDASWPPMPYYDILIRYENTSTGTVSPKIDGATVIRLGIVFY